MSSRPPAITGKQLIRLLVRDGWMRGRKITHGIALSKPGSDGHLRITIVPDKGSPLPDGTLAAILGPKQTGIGRQGLLDLISAYGL